MNTKWDIRGKYCLVTGATDGIGRETARVLAGKGARVIVVGRNEGKAERVVRQIRQETGNETVEYMLADFSSLAQVRRLAEDYQAAYPRLDVLINNAGAMFMRRQKSEDGFEMTLAVNHLAPFLLSNLLLETLKASAPARIVNVASNAHEGASLDFDDLQHQNRYRPMAAYGESKLANVYFTYELAGRLEGSSVTANALHPGLVATNMGANNFPAGSLIKRLVNVFFLDVAKGAQTVIYLAASPDVEGVSGKYFYKREAIRSSAVSHDKVAARRLWEMSANMVGLVG